MIGSLRILHADVIGFTFAGIYKYIIVKQIKKRT